MRNALLALVLALLMSGCWPSACQREEHRELFPADSLSRELARAEPADTLTHLWDSGPSFDDAPALEHPRTLLYGEDGRLYLSDAEADRIFTLDDEGQPLEVIESDDLDHPYLAGLRGDTVLVFNPADHHIDFFIDGASAHRIPTPENEDLPEEQPLLYTAADADHVYFKAVGENFDNYVARLSRDGAIEERLGLPGPYWRHAGLLRPWGDTLASLSFYRPVVDVMPRELSESAARVDTLALMGFDSPMLGRSRSFVEGDLSEPPMMAMSASAAGDYLFVLNARPGWVHVDVFDREGELVRALSQADVQPSRSFYPMDLAVREREDGNYDIAVALIEPDPHVRLYRWTP